MPRKDGFQACAEIRQWEKARKLPLVPIIALSANVMSDVSGKCAAAGFSNYVAKPVDFEVLSSAIKELLDPTKAHLLMYQQFRDGDPPVRPDVDSAPGPVAPPYPITNATSSLDPTKAYLVNRHHKDEGFLLCPQEATSPISATSESQTPTTSPVPSFTPGSTPLMSSQLPPTAAPPRTA